jgi:hypothetical protein
MIVKEKNEQTAKDCLFIFDGWMAFSQSELPGRTSG